MEMTLSLREGGVLRHLKKIPAEYGRFLHDAVYIYCEDFVGRFGEERLSGRTADDQGLKRRSGKLQQQLGFDITGKTLKDLEARMGWFRPEAAKIARVHEFGARIRPKKGRALAIPLKDALTPGGVLKQRFRVLGSLRELPNTFLRHNIIFEKKFFARQTKLIPLFVLVGGVTIPPRLGFFAYAKSSAETGRRSTLLRKAVKLTLDRIRALRNTNDN